MLEVAPQPGRHPLGDAGFDPAFRVDERIVVVAGRWSACAGRLRRTSRTRSSFDCAWGASSRSPSTSSRAAPPEKDRNASVQAAQLRQTYAFGGFPFSAPSPPGTTAARPMRRPARHAATSRRRPCCGPSWPGWSLQRSEPRRSKPQTLFPLERLSAGAGDQANEGFRPGSL